MRPAAPSAVLEYRFRQPFDVPARSAYAWATDYAPDDWEIAGVRGRREVTRVAPQMVRLTDRLESDGEGGVAKVRWVQLYPRTLSWVSTHVAGPCLHSQFRYTIRLEGRGRSSLQFEGREIRWDTRPVAASERGRLRRTLRREDVALWRAFARAMESDYRSRRR